jgi:hypothetical protein
MEPTRRSWILWTVALWVASGAAAWGQSDQRPRDRTPLLDLFLELDENADRVIERAEVPEAALKAFDEVLKLGDLDHDGRLDAGEYRDLLRQLLARRAADGPGREARPNAGEPGAGPELGGRARFGPGGAFRGRVPDRAAIEMRLKRLMEMDTNADGRISRDEFTGPPMVFDRLDHNRDGHLDREDRRLARERRGRPGPDSPLGRRGRERLGNPAIDRFLEERAQRRIERPGAGAQEETAASDHDSAKTPQSPEAKSSESPADR